MSVVQVYNFGGCGETHHVQNLKNTGLSQQKIAQIPAMFTKSQLRQLKFSDLEIAAIIKESHAQAAENTDDMFA